METLESKLKWIRYIFYIKRSTFMFLLYEYDIFWAFLIILSLIPILAFLIFGILAPISKGLEKLSSYESGIEPIGRCLVTISNPLLYVCSHFCCFWCWNGFSLSMGNEFWCIRGIRIFRSFLICAYTNCWFSLCMTKGALEWS